MALGIGGFSPPDGKLVRDGGNKVIIRLSDDALENMTEAIRTVGHELRHIDDFLKGMRESEEVLARAAEETFLKSYIDWLKRVRQG